MLITLRLTPRELASIECALLLDLETVNNGLNEVREWDEDKKIILRVLRKIEKCEIAIDTYIDKPK